jgi:ABC-type multidrug transport system ATPase subunit
LESLVAPGVVSVIVTTHHEEEARKAHVFAIMQSGRILAEDTPASMVASFGMSSLGDVIYHVLCQAEEKGAIRGHQPEEDGAIGAVKSLLAGCRRLSSRLRTTGRQQYDVEGIMELAARTSKKNSEPKLLGAPGAGQISPNAQQCEGWCPRLDALFSWRRTSSLFVKNVITLRRNTA